jgi:hypothetical protein
VDDTQEPSREVDDEQLGARIVLQLDVVERIPEGVEGTFDVAAEDGDAVDDLVEQLPGGDRDVGGEDRGTAGQERLREGAVPAVPVKLPTVPVIGGRVGPGGQRLAQAGSSVAGADVAVPPDRVGEFHEPAVLLGDLKGREPPGWPPVDHPCRFGHPGSSLGAARSVFAVDLQAGWSWPNVFLRCLRSVGVCAARRVGRGRLRVGEDVDQAPA